MPRLKFTIEYDGSAYCGWQEQLNGPTVQGELQKALRVVFKKDIKIIGSGRTDAGVHARNQIAHGDFPEHDLFKLQKSLNGILKRDIVIKKIETADPGFHARFDAIEREYKFYVSRKPTALNRTISWSFLYPLNITLMQTAADRLKHCQDFKSFCKAHSGNKTYRCKIRKSHWKLKNDQLIYTVAADRFLYGMVRALVGTMLAIGQGKTPLKQLDEIINSRNRANIPYTVPGKGLVLEKVTY